MGTSAKSGSGGPAPALRVWRCSRGLLVHHGPQRTLTIDQLLATAGQSGYDSPSYVLVDGRGGVTVTYSVATWSTEGERGAAFHVVEGACLLKVTITERAGRVPGVTTEPVLTDLAPVPPDDVDAYSRAASALRTDVDPTVVQLRPRPGT